MPHFDSDEVVQHVTFHLADSLPAAALEQIAADLKRFPPEKRDEEKRRKIEALIDAGHGSCLLRQACHAELVQASLLTFDDARYRLFAWVIMPNHVHVLFQTMNGWSMAKIVALWKAYTGRRIYDVIRRDGARPSQGQDGDRRFQSQDGDQCLRNQNGTQAVRVWQREYWDRFIRDEQQFANTLAYIHNNPVKAKLAERPEDWRWSSAFPENALFQERLALERRAPPRRLYLLRQGGARRS